MSPGILFNQMVESWTLGVFIPTLFGILLAVKGLNLGFNGQNQVSFTEGLRIGNVISKILAVKFFVLFAKVNKSENKIGSQGLMKTNKITSTILM